MRWIYHETRPLERLHEQYELECKLHKRLMTATKEKRRGLYTDVYDELLRKFPDNRMLAGKYDKEFSKRQIHNAMQMLGRWLNMGSTFLEIGPGDCSFALEVCKYVQKVYVVDVSYELTAGITQPEDFELIISDGTRIPVESKSVDIAYSNQYMEHIHPEDALEQLNHIFIALKVGGRYLCRTPHRQSGPHDVSKWFSDTPDGMHLKEYTYRELNDIFKSVDFKKVQAIIGARGHYLPFRVPIFSVILLERLLAKMPFGKKLANTILIRALLGMQVIAIK